MKAPQPDVDWRLLTMGIAHELRGNLQAITTSAFAAQRDASRDPKWLARIEKNAVRSQRILEDLLAAGTLAHTTASVSDAVALAMDDLTLGDDARDRVRFVTQVGESDTVAAHGGLLARVLHVLFENAVRANAGAAALVITTTLARDASAVRITVSDDGAGVPDDIASTLFDEGVSGAGSSGLGLPLAREICRVHGGTLVLTAPKPATFVVSLPG